MEGAVGGPEARVTNEREVEVGSRSSSALVARPSTGGISKPV